VGVQSNFFCGVLHGFLENLVLQYLLAQHPLQLGNPGPRCGQL